MLRSGNLLYTLLILLISGCSSQKIVNYKSENVLIDTSFSDNELDSIINPYRESMDEVMNEIIGSSDSSLIKFQPESPLGNFVTDVVFDAGFQFLGSLVESQTLLQKSFCLLNFGGLRSSLNQGDITVGNIYELMPFDNSIVIVELTPLKIKELLQYLYKADGQPISNAEMKLSEEKQELNINGVEYLFDKNIFVITSNYLADGGDKMNFFKNSVNKWDTGLLIRNVLIDNVKKEKVIPFYPVENRLQIVRDE